MHEEKPTTVDGSVRLAIANRRAESGFLVRNAPAALTDGLLLGEIRQGVARALKSPSGAPIVGADFNAYCTQFDGRDLPDFVRPALARVETSTLPQRVLHDRLGSLFRAQNFEGIAREDAQISANLLKVARTYPLDRDERLGVLSGMLGRYPTMVSGQNLRGFSEDIPEDIAEGVGEQMHVESQKMRGIRGGGAYCALPLSHLAYRLGFPSLRMPPFTDRQTNVRVGLTFASSEPNPAPHYDANEHGFYLTTQAGTRVQLGAAVREWGSCQTRPGSYIAFRTQLPNSAGSRDDFLDVERIKSSDNFKHIAWLWRYLQAEDPAVILQLYADKFELFKEIKPTGDFRLRDANSRFTEINVGTDFQGVPMKDRWVYLGGHYQKTPFKQ